MAQLIGIPSGDATGGTHVVGYHPETLHYNAWHQQWIFRLVAGTSDVYTIQNVRSGTYLDLWGGDKNNGAAITAFGGHGRENQQWKVYGSEWLDRHR
jgi:hypothetical protein